MDYQPVVKWHWLGFPNGRSPAGASVTRLICQASLSECCTAGVRTRGHRSGKKHQLLQGRKVMLVTQATVCQGCWIFCWTELLGWSCSYLPTMFSSKSEYFDIEAQILGQKLCCLFSGPHLQHYPHAAVVYRLKVSDIKHYFSSKCKPGASTHHCQTIITPKH